MRLNGQIHKLMLKTQKKLQKQLFMSVKVNGWERNDMIILDLCGSSVIINQQIHCSCLLGLEIVFCARQFSQRQNS